MYSNRGNTASAPRNFSKLILIVWFFMHHVVASDVVLSKSISLWGVIAFFIMLCKSKLTPEKIFSLYSNCLHLPVSYGDDWYSVHHKYKYSWGIITNKECTITYCLRVEAEALYPIQMFSAVQYTWREGLLWRVDSGARWGGGSLSISTKRTHIPPSAHKRRDENGRLFS